MIEKRLACSILAVFYFCSAIFLTAAPLAAQAPVAHWKFDEGSGTVAFDSSGNGQSALLSNDVSWVNGARGWAISSSNANRGYVSTSPIDLSGTEAVTVAFWAKRTYTTSGGVLIEAGEGYQSSTTGFALLPDDDTCRGIQAAVRGDQGTTANCYSQPSSGVWHHLAIVYDKSQTGGNGITFYVDGALQRPTWNLASVTNTNNFGKNPLHLFSRADGSQFSSGTVKDLQVYNRALQSTEIQQLYSGPQQFTVTQGISYVQGNYASWQSLPAGSVTFTTAQAAGDLNVVVVGWHDNMATISTVADSAGNVYTRAVGPTVTGGLSQSIYYAKNITPAGAGSNTVNVTFSRPAFHPDIRILEYSGVDPANPVDVTSANGGIGFSASSGSATTTDPTDLIFGADVVSGITFGPGSSFTARMLTQDGSMAEDRVVNSVGSYSATAPVLASWIMQMVAFRARPGFTISASPASLSVAQGAQGTSTITTALSGGFNSAISLSASGMPSGTTVSFSPNPIPAPGSGSALMTITLGLSTPTGTYPITVTGNGGGTQQTTTVTLTVVQPPSFTISASPASLSLAQGYQGTSTITTALSGGFNSAISLSASGMPSGTTVSFSPNPIPAPGSGSAVMTITVGLSTPTGTYPLTVTGNDGGTQQTTTVTLTVVQPPSFTISASPASLTVMQGGQGTSTITTALSGGFNSAISLSASGMPSGTTVSFSPNPIPAPGSGTAVMTITVGSATQIGTYSITVTGSGGGIYQSVTLTLTVTAQVCLSWSASQSPGVAGYNIYRSTTSGGPYTKMNSSLDTSTTFNDQAVQDGYTYYYVTTAVDNEGNESSYSNEASATIQ